MASFYTVSNLSFSERRKRFYEKEILQHRYWLEKQYRFRIVKLSEGPVRSYMIDQGNFCGDELLSKCAPKTFSPRLRAKFTSLEVEEISALDAQRRRYVTEHHRLKPANEKLNQTSYYHFSNWIPAAVINQSEWKKYELRAHAAFSSASDVFLAPAITNPFSGLSSHYGPLHVYAAMLVP